MPRTAIVHHEVFHLVDHYGGWASPRDDEWCFLNPLGFTYERKYESSTDPDHDGFASNYAKTSALYDKAETFSYLASVREKLERDASHQLSQKHDYTLAGKMQLIKRCAETLGLNDDFWVKANPAPPVAPDTSRCSTSGATGSTSESSTRE